LSQIIAVIHQAAAGVMRVNDDGTLMYRLWQYCNALDGTAISGFEREPFSGKRVLFFGPKQRAQEKQNDQSNPENILSRGHGTMI
jgi:hypothetical protein